MRKLKIAILCMLLGATVKAQSAISDHNEAYTVVNKWLKAIDGNQVKDMKELISTEMQNVMPSDEILSVLSERRLRLGILEGRKLVKSEKHGAIYSFPKAEYVAFTFISNYSQRRQLKRLVRVIKENGSWRIMSDLELN
jgi:uncharacterized protein DUF4019